MQNLFRNSFASKFAALSIFLVVATFQEHAHAEWRFYNSNVLHYGQEENWICGPTTISMWASAIWRSRGEVISYSGKRVDLRNENIPAMDIANSCCRGGRNGDATNIKEFTKGIYDWTPANPPHVFAEWEYIDPETAVKGVMYSVARFGEPVAVAGGGGNHYVLIRGGRADRNPYTHYGESNHIRGVYVNDATEDSPKYRGPVSKMYRDREYSPQSLMNYWTKIGARWDKKYRAIERYGTVNGKTYENNQRHKNF